MLVSLVNFLPILILFIVGYTLKVRKFVKEDTIKDIKSLIVNLFLPSLLFLAFLRTNFETRYMLIVLAMFLVCLLALLLGFLLRGLFKIKYFYFPFLMSGFEAGMLGYSLYTFLFGKENIARFAIVDLGQVMFVFLVMVTLLLRYSEEKKSSILNSFNYFLKVPVIWAILLGIIINKTGLLKVFTGNFLWESIVKVLEMLGGLTAPLIGIIIGYELNFKNIDFSSSKYVFIRYVFMVIFAMLFNKYIVVSKLGLDKLFTHAVFIMFLLPPPYVVPLYVKDENEQKFLFNNISLSTVISIVLILIYQMIFI